LLESVISSLAKTIISPRLFNLLKARGEQPN